MTFTELADIAHLNDPAATAAEAFEERAAILEHQGGFDRIEAESKAWQQSGRFVRDMTLYAMKMNQIRIAARFNQRRGKR